MKSQEGMMAAFHVLGGLAFIGRDYNYRSRFQESGSRL